MAVIIDLTSDDIEVAASDMIDLTSGYDPRASSNALREPEVKVEDESSTLAESSTIDSGESTPKMQRDGDIALTESNPTDVGDLSPRNEQGEVGTSSDDDLTLGTILARSRKRKRGSDVTSFSQSKATDVRTPLTHEALGSLVGSQSLKPSFTEFWSVRKRLANEASPPETQQDDDDGRTQQEEDERFQYVGPPAGNTNSQILNIVREEVFGPEKKTRKKKHRSGPSSQAEPAKQQMQGDGRASSTPAPRRAVSEAPESVRLKSKARTPELVKVPKPGQEKDGQHPQKRRKHSGREDTASASTSLSIAHNTTRNQAASVENLQGHRSKHSGIERRRPTGKDKATDISTRHPRYHPGNTNRHRAGKATSRERRQMKETARARDKVQGVERVGNGRHQREQTYLVAAPNERGDWTPSGFQHAGMTNQRPLKRKTCRIATSDQNESLHEVRNAPSVLDSDSSGTQLPSFENKSGQKTNSDRGGRFHEDHEGANDLDFSATGSEPPFESDIPHQEAVGQSGGLHGLPDLPNKDLQGLQQAHSDDDQQEIRSSQTKYNTAQLSRRLQQVQQPTSLDNREKDLQDARAFFNNYCSTSAQKHKTIMVDSVPADLGRPSYSDRCRLVNNSTGRASVRKLRTAAQLARDRAIKREKSLRLKRENEMKKDLPNESKEDKEKRIEAKIAKSQKTFEKNDKLREAQKARGLLTVDFLENHGVIEGNPINGLPAAAPKGMKRGIPIAQALEPGATLTLYVVYLSDPVDKDKKLAEHHMKRLGDQFLKKEDANEHAEKVLRKELQDSHLVSIQFRVGPEDGLFFGTKELADGKMVMCMVQRERQMVGDLDLRNIHVRKELKEIHCPRFDVFYINVIPGVFLEKEEDSVEEKTEKKSEPDLSTSGMDAGDGKEHEPESGENEHLDENSNSLFSATPTPEPEAGHEEESGAQTGEKEQHDHVDDTDADSVATDATLEALQPGGNLGSLSWKHVEYMHEYVGSFTTMEIANKEAIKVALKLWRPRGSRMDPWLYYRDAIKPSLVQARDQELDVEAARLEFEVPDFEGHIDERPWPFIYSTVLVEKTKLEGPMDIGNYIVMDDGEGGRGEDGEDDENGEDGEND